MKKETVILIGLLAVMHAPAQQQAAVDSGCDCPACQAKAKGERQPYVLPALQELNQATAATNRLPQHAGEEVHEDHAGCGHDPVQDHDMAAAQDHQGSHDYDHHEEHGQAVEGVELSSEMAGKVGIRIHEAKSGTIVQSAIFPAEIKLNRDRTAELSPRYPSMVRQVFAEIGDEVRKGDRLAVLENRETLAVYTLAAPLKGVVISKDTVVGEVADEDKVLFEISDLSSVWADISIFPQYQHLLHKGMPVEFVAHDGHTAKGSIKYISPIVSHETRTFTARCILEGADEDFTPGAFVRARINVQTADVPVRVPRAALQTLEGETVLFVPGDHGFQPVEVETGLTDEHHVEIRNGLNPGDRYVAVGAFALKAQMVTSGLDPHAGHGH